MIANDLFFLDTRGEGGGGSGGGGRRAAGGAPAPAAGGDLPVDRSDMQPRARPPDDDIPF